MQETKTIQLDTTQAKNLQSLLVDLGWVEQGINNPYVVLRMKSNQNSVAMLYSSNKLVLQGDLHDITSVFEILNIGGIDPHLGVDEVGKGDYFGPLVVVSCFVNEESGKIFKDLGVGDSKKFSDKRIMEMYEAMKDYEYYYASIVQPSEYNTLNSELKNVSILLAKQHSKVIEMGVGDLKAKNIQCDYVVIDQFSNTKSRVANELGTYGRSIEVKQFHKGESDLAVACASVLARGLFLSEMESMSMKYGFRFPKGATDVINDGKAFVREFGKDELKNVAKISFRTTKSIL